MRQSVSSPCATRLKWAGALLFFVLCIPTAWAGEGALEGRVVDSSGQPVAGATVYAYDKENYTYFEKTGDDGIYDIHVPAPGVYSVTVLAPGYMETTVTNLQAVDGQHIELEDIELKVAPNFPIVKAAAPISLTAGIDSAEFANAPEIRLDQPYQVVVGLDQPNAWGGPAVASGRFKVKWDAQALYFAGDVTFPKLHLNSHTDGNLWKGNAIEFYIQNDAYSRDRTAYNPDHNWQLVLADGPTPAWWLFGAVQARPNANLAENLALSVKPDGTGFFFRLNVPWSMLLKENKEGSPPPTDESLGAIAIALNTADLESDPTDTTRKLQMMWPGTDSNWTNPSGLRPAIFTAKAP